jgi:hypothetical protein
MLKALERIEWTSQPRKPKHNLTTSTSRVPISLLRYRLLLDRIVWARCRYIANLLKQCRPTMGYSV